MYGFFDDDGLYELTLTPNEMGLVTRAAQVFEDYCTEAPNVEALRRLTDIYLSAPDESIVSWAIDDERKHRHSEEELAQVESAIRDSLKRARVTWEKTRGRA